MKEVTVKFKKLKPEAIIPKYQSSGAACFDIHALIEKDIILKPQEHSVVPTGLSVAIPEGYEMQVRPRSGLSAKSAITVVNSPGTVDSDYINEVKVIIQNNIRDKYMYHTIGYESTNECNYTIKNGDRIAQCKISIVPKITIVEVDEFSEEEITKDRGGGFGSTGR